MAEQLVGRLLQQAHQGLQLPFTVTDDQTHGGLVTIDVTANGAATAKVSDELNQGMLAPPSGLSVTVKYSGGTVASSIVNPW